MRPVSQLFPRVSNAGKERRWALDVGFQTDPNSIPPKEAIAVRT